MEIFYPLAFSISKASVSITLAIRGMILEQTYTAASSNFSY